MKILLVDDEPMALTSLQRVLKHRGIRNVTLCDNGRDAIDAIQAEDFDIVLLDLLMQDVDGMQVLEATRSLKPHTEFIMVTAVDDVCSAVKAVRLGAYDYLVKPVDNERLFLALDHAYERRALRVGLASPPCRQEKEDVQQAFPEVITQCVRMQKLLHYTELMAKTDQPIMVTGESGTGKELIARGIHRLSDKAAGPFIPVNVCSIAETMFESQFFGHVKGAFTGASRDFPGYFEQANGGTLFLDEIGDLSPPLQAKFLRVLEEKTVTRLGDTKPIPVDVRIVSATNVDLDKACQEEKFRLDLIYRLKATHVFLPPLRERKEDIPLLARYFLKEAADQYKKEVHGFSEESLSLLVHKPLPGNIRELAQLVQNGVLQAEQGLVLPEHLGEQVPLVFSLDQQLCSLKEAADKHLLYVLTQTKGDRHLAAEILGVSVRQVQRKLAQLKKQPVWAEIMQEF